MERKEAIEVIKKNWPDSSFTMLREALESLIPELKESGDERIRKHLISFFDNLVTFGNASICETEDTKVDDILAWLEKQGEKPNNAYDKELSEILGRVIRRYINDPDIPYSDREKVSMEIIPYVERLEKQGEQKSIVVIPKFRVGDVIRPKGSTAEYTIESIFGECYHGKGWGLHISGDDDYELVEQNPAWSEEDEEIHRRCICAMRASACGFPEEEKFVEQVDNWLKSLKDRVLPQPKQEWSEEDENIKESIITGLEMLKDGASDKSLIALYNKKIEWLKSIRPQSQWKPSDEQMKMVDEIINVLSQMQLFGGRNALIDLKHDLEKLREE